MSITTAGETTLYADQNVLVSTTRLVVAGTTYPLANVSSVRLIERPPNRTFAVVLVIVGVVLLMMQLFAAALVVGGLGVLALLMLRTTYVMLVGSSGGEHSALSSKNRPYVSAVVEHVNSAIVARG